MPDYILIDGDKANFISTFALAIVDVQPGTLQASGPATLDGKKLCVDGDEKKVEVKGCTYKTAVHTIPGVGTLKIQALGPDQKAQKTSTGGKLVLLKGSSFIAVFEVQTPAKQPATPSPIPDPTPKYPGTGTFSTTNAKFQGY